MHPNQHDSSPVAALREFLKLESASGILLVIAGVLGMIAANTPLHELYQTILQMPIKLQVGAIKFDKTLLIWINDLLMAIFFLLVGLEIKREVVSGELSDRARVALPAIAALGGMIVPAAIYAAQLERSGRHSRLGHPVGDRHRVRARRALALRRPRAHRTQGVPDDARGPRRPRCDRHHRDLLQPMTCRSTRCCWRRAPSSCCLR